MRSGNASGPGAERHGDGDRAAVALDLDVDALARLVVAHDHADIVGLVYGPAADAEDDVPRAQAGRVAGAAGDDAADDGAGGPGLRARRPAEIGAVDRLAAGELRHDAAQRGGRDGEADADGATAPARGRDLRVDADHAAGRVQQRPARVARVDGRVGLDRLVDLEAVGRLDLAPNARHDARGDRPVEAERVADGHGGVADLDLVGVRERQRLDALRGAAGDLDHGEVGGGVAADDLRRVVAAVVAEADLRRGGALDDVGVGDDRPVVGDQEAGAAGRRAAAVDADEDDARARGGVDGAHGAGLLARGRAALGDVDLRVGAQAVAAEDGL